MSMAADKWDSALSLVCYLGYSWCVSCFLKRHLHGKRLEQEVFCGLLFCSYSMMTLFLVNPHTPYILYVTLNHGMLIGLTMAVFEGEKEKKLLAAIILAAITTLIWNFCESFLCCAGLVVIHAITDCGQMTVIDGWRSRVIEVMTYAAGITAVSLLSKPLDSAFIDKRKSWCLCLTVPLACIILATDLANWAASNGIMVQDWGNYGLYENQLFSHGAMCIFTGLSMGAAGFFVFGMDKIDREEKARQQYQSQVMCYQMMEEQYGRMESLRHDMKNHMIVLENLVQNRQWEQAGDYLRGLTKAGSVEAGDEVTGSLAMDALLYHKRQQAIEKGIRWQCDARLPADSPVKEMDLCIIAGNILDNAVEACSRQKEISKPLIQVYMGTVKKCLFLEVRNSTDLSDKQDTSKSRKENSKEHGLGLVNIKAAVDRYNGAVHVQVEKGVFMISVLLPLYQEGLSD